MNCRTCDSAPPGPGKEPPLVSIIVPTFNRGPYLERCLRSILDQTYRRLECLVMDGGSKDESVAVLERLAAADSRLRFLSEPDRGEVYATNKGLDLIQGDIIGIQASDDYYAPDAVQTSVQFLLAHPEFIGVGGDVVYVDASGKSLGRGAITYRGRLSPERLKRILVLRYFVCPVIHGTFFGWRHRLARHGKFDPDCSVCPDVEFYLRVLAGGDSIGCLPRVQTFYTVHPDMGAVKHYHKVRQELNRLYARHGLRWYHHCLRLTLGRALSYFGNPMRSPFLPGVARELREFWTMRLKRRAQKP
ncbi:MAG TPA: glycosyltransferase [Dongiaceae bacterium]|nr:glycosyltransferase [Dongiaceae bacterium]